MGFVEVQETIAQLKISSKLTDVAQFPDVLERLYNIILSSTKSTVEANKYAERGREDYNTLRNSIKMYVFLLHWFLISAKQLPNTAGVTKKKVKSCVTENDRNREVNQRRAESKGEDGKQKHKRKVC